MKDGAALAAVAHEKVRLLDWQAVAVAGAPGCIEAEAACRCQRWATGSAAQGCWLAAQGCQLASAAQPLLAEQTAAERRPRLPQASTSSPCAYPAIHASPTYPPGLRPFLPENCARVQNSMKVLGNLSEWTSNPSGSTFRPLKVTFRVSPKTLTGLELDFWRLEVDF